jgi:hypothetical protein
MQIKTTMRYYFTLTRMSEIKKTDNNLKGVKNVHTLELSCTTGRDVICSHFGKHFDSS